MCEKDLMKIRNVVHKGLRKLIVDDDASGVQSAVVSKLHKIVSFMQEIENSDSLKAAPQWKAQ